MEKMSIRISSTLLACLLMGTAGARGDQPKSASGGEDVWRKALPNTAIEAIRPDPRLPGIYEIVMGDKVVYGDATGRYLMFGHLFDVRTQQDLTQQHLDELAVARRIPWEDLPLEHALKENLAPPQAPKLAVLLNPQCAWCRKLYYDIKSEKDKAGEVIRKGIEYEADVRFMILAPEKPVSSKSPDYYAYYLADRIVCGGSPELNLQRVMQDEDFLAQFQADPFEAVLSPGSRLIRKLLPSAQADPQKRCDSAPALEAVRIFFLKHGLSGTPVLISGDGRVHRGYLPPYQLLAWLRDVSAGSGESINTMKEGAVQ